MYKRTITFKDYDGNERTEDFYFNLSRAEIWRMNYTSEEDFEKKILRMIDERDTRKLYKMFEEIVQLSVGKKSVDGRRFVKNDEILSDFMETEAYSELIEWMLSNADNATKFINAVLPEKKAVDDAPATEPGEVIPADVTVN